MCAYVCTLGVGLETALKWSLFLSLIFLCARQKQVTQSSLPRCPGLPPTTQGLNQSLWPLTFLSSAFQVKSQSIGLWKRFSSGVPGGEGDFLVSPLSSVGFSRYDPVLGPRGLEPGEGLANVSPQCFWGIPDRAHQSCLLSVLHALVHLSWLADIEFPAGLILPAFILRMWDMGREEWEERKRRWG